MTDSENLEPRKASNILLVLEAKIEQLLHLARSQDLNIKILSNKINNLIEEFHSLTIEEPVVYSNFPTQVTSQNSYEAEIISSKTEYQLPLEKNPTGFRRTSRPETYISESVFTEVPPKSVEPELLYNPKKQVKNPVFPIANKPQIIQAQQSQSPSMDVVSKSPVIQRIMDKNGKVVFLANVEIINTQTNKIEHTSRTSSVGKWQASLSPGTYKVNVKKQEALSKTKINATSEFSVAKSGVVLELPDLIAR